VPGTYGTSGSAPTWAGTSGSGPSSNGVGRAAEKWLGAACYDYRCAPTRSFVTADAHSALPLATILAIPSHTCLRPLLHGPNVVAG
jgi:hypothetical protein